MVTISQPFGNTVGYVIFSQEAAFKLGMMYLKGQNVEQNTHKAMFYLNQARNLGHGKADITFI